MNKLEKMAILFELSDLMNIANRNANWCNDESVDRKELHRSFQSITSKVWVLKREIQKIEIS